MTKWKLEALLSDFYLHLIKPELFHMVTTNHGVILALQ